MRLLSAVVICLLSTSALAKPLPRITELRPF